MAATKKEIVLLVEDNEPVGQRIVGVLEAAGYKVFWAKDGVDGVRMAEAHEPDVVYLDIYLPELNGYEVIKEIRKRGIRTRVAMMSSIDIDTKTTIKCIQEGACDFFAKDVDNFSDFVGRTKRHLLTATTINKYVSDDFESIIALLKEDNKGLSTRAVDLERQVVVLAGHKQHPLRVVGQSIVAGLTIMSLVILLYFEKVPPLYAMPSIVLIVVGNVIPWDRVLRLSAEGQGMKADMLLSDENRRGESKD